MAHLQKLLRYVTSLSDDLLLDASDVPYQSSLQRESGDGGE
nr:MAG TPA: hypothetical protein [Caudoviricetes sp.]